jgi:hypothetical protein
VRYARGERAPAIAGLARFRNVVLIQIARAIEEAGLAALRGELRPGQAMKARYRYGLGLSTPSVLSAFLASRGDLATRKDAPRRSR